MSLNRINYPRAGVLEHDDPSLLMHEWYTRDSVDRFLAKNCEKLAYAIRRSNYDNIIKYQKEILIADFTNYYRKSIYNLIFLLNQSVGDIADVVLSGGDGLNYILPKDLREVSPDIDVKVVLRLPDEYHDIHDKMQRGEKLPPDTCIELKEKYFYTINKIVELLTNSVLAFNNPYSPTTRGRWNKDDYSIKIKGLLYFFNTEEDKWYLKYDLPDRTGKSPRQKLLDYILKKGFLPPHNVKKYLDKKFDYDKENLDFLKKKGLPFALRISDMCAGGNNPPFTLNNVKLIAIDCRYSQTIEYFESLAGVLDVVITIPGHIGYMDIRKGNYSESLPVNALMSGEQTYYKNNCITIAYYIYESVKMIKYGLRSSNGKIIKDYDRFRMLINYSKTEEGWRQKIMEQILAGFHVSSVVNISQKLKEFTDGVPAEFMDELNEKISNINTALELTSGSLSHSSVPEPDLGGGGGRYNLKGGYNCVCPNIIKTFEDIEKEDIILKNNEKTATTETAENITELKGTHDEIISILMTQYGSSEMDCEEDYNMLLNPNMEFPDNSSDTSSDALGGGATQNNVQSGGGTYKDNIDSLYSEHMDLFRALSINEPTITKTLATKLNIWDFLVSCLKPEDHPPDEKFPPDSELNNFPWSFFDNNPSLTMDGETRGFKYHYDMEEDERNFNDGLPYGVNFERLQNSDIPDVSKTDVNDYITHPNKSIFQLESEDKVTFRNGKKSEGPLSIISRKVLTMNSEKIKLKNLLTLLCDHIELRPDKVHHLTQFRSFMKDEDLEDAPVERVSIYINYLNQDLLLGMNPTKLRIQNAAFSDTNIKKHVNLRLFELIERLNAILNLSYFTNML